MISQALRDALADTVVRPVIATAIHWPEAVTRVHTGVGELELDGETFYGVGSLGAVSSVRQQSGDSPTRLQLSLTGFDDSLRGEVLRAKYQGRPVTVWLVALDAGYRAIANQVLWRGAIADAQVNVGDTNQLEITVSNRLEDWDKKRADRFTDESQQARHPGDRLFRYVPIMAEWPIYWGSDKQATPLRDAL